MSQDSFAVYLEAEMDCLAGSEYPKFGFGSPDAGAHVATRCV